MSLRKENCILVVNDHQELLGIFTAKDLAFRIVGSNLNANTTLIEQIMTPSPVCCKVDTAASEALNLMVQRAFRHLPIVNDDNQIVGVLDITKCYNEAMLKLERMYENSKKLHEALEGVHGDIGLSQDGQPLQVIQYFENLKKTINGPTLTSVLDQSTHPVYIDIRANVYEAAMLMRENRTTALLVKDSNDEVAGIFTSKDVVLRVIAAGLEPKSCSVIRVMTPKPDCASGNLSIHQALRKMFEGKFLNLPVLDEFSGEIVGIVEVLKLTYATLNQIKSWQSPEQEGPAWNQFWTSMETESLHSANSEHEVTQSEYQQFLDNDVGPSDSISASGVEQGFSFKFKSPLGRTHRVTLKGYEGVAGLRCLLDSKLNSQERASLKEYAISYYDDEGDLVAIISDEDVLDCIAITKRANKDKADLLIHHPERPPTKGMGNELLIGGAVLAVAIVVLFAWKRR